MEDAMERCKRTVHVSWGFKRLLSSNLVLQGSLKHSESVHYEQMKQGKAQCRTASPSFSTARLMRRSSSFAYSATAL
eukprot:6208204-Pleurochrysis_carterae.AAC.6